jgi:hypothetical protein
MLGAAQPDASYESLVDFSLGKRNEVLARLRGTLFGESLGIYLDCPKCGLRQEFSLRTEIFSAPKAGEETGNAVEVEGFRFRPVTTRDLAAVVNERDPHQAALLMAKSCCLSDGTDPHWTDEFLEKVEDSLGEADPAADIELEFACNGCGRGWRENFDIVDYLWEEIEVRAMRLIREVHGLASAYGWTESEILSLSRERRNLYLEMAGV